MKQTIFIGLFLIPILCFSQQKKDTKIIVTVPDTANLFNRVALMFYEQGYILEHKDGGLKFMATGEKADGSRSYKYKALIKDTTITITGQVANNVTFSFGGAKSERVFLEVFFGGMKRSDLRLAWQEMQRLAELLKGRITYSK